MRIVLDTNVLVYVYVSPEFVPKIRKEEWYQLNRKANILFEDILTQKYMLIVPSVVLIELASTISGMTGEEEKAREAADEVRSSAIIAYDDPIFTEQAIHHGVKLKLSGFDTKIATCAIINSANLITNDKKFFDKFSSKAKDYGIKVFLFRRMSEKEIKSLA